MVGDSPGQLDMLLPCPYHRRLWEVRDGYDD